MVHTNGKWIAIKTTSEKYMASVQDENQSEIALIAGVDVDEANANACLIAAAPDLLVACEEFIRKCDCGEAKSKRSYAQMKAAIAKATGD